MSSNTEIVEQSSLPTWAHAVRRVCSFPVMIASLLAALSVLTVRSRFDDPDLWWHLRMGQVIWTSHTIPTTDLFSYTTGHHSYIPHEWLAQIVVYGSYLAGGFPGMMFLLCVLASLLLIAGYGLCWIYSENAKVAFVGAMTIWLFSTIGLAIRPQMMGYSLLIIELFLLHLGRTRDSRLFFCLPPLFAIWVNAHGSFSLGLFIAGVTLVSSFFHLRAGPIVSSEWSPGRRRDLTWAVLLSAGALLLNPVGMKQILYPINTLLHQPVGISEVQEWQPLGFDDPRAYALLTVLACIALLVIVRQKEIFWQELLMLATGTWLAASHRRMLFVFGILAAPVVSRLLADEWDNYYIEQDRPGPNLVLIAASLLTMFLAFPSSQALGTQVETQSPVKAVEFIKADQLSGNMLNEYVFGGYLIWAMPEHPVFVDGRSDVFEETGVLKVFADWATLQSDPANLLDKYNIRFCLLARQSPMAKVLPLLGWTAVYSDTNSTIFIRNTPGK